MTTTTTLALIEDAEEKAERCAYWPTLARRRQSAEREAERAERRARMTYRDARQAARRVARDEAVAIARGWRIA